MSKADFNVSQLPAVSEYRYDAHLGHEGKEFGGHDIRVIYNKLLSGSMPHLHACPSTLPCLGNRFQ